MKDSPNSPSRSLKRSFFFNSKKDRKMTPASAAASFPFSREAPFLLTNSFGKTDDRYSAHLRTSTCTYTHTCARVQTSTYTYARVQKHIHMHVHTREREYAGVSRLVGMHAVYYGREYHMKPCLLLLSLRRNTQFFIGFPLNTLE